MKQIFAASFRKYVAGGILLGILSGCSVFDPPEDIPSYIHIDAMTLTAVGQQGSSDAKIQDAWVYMDGELLGAYQLPCTVPILAEGQHQFIISGGVRENGLSSLHAVYPFWKGWTGTINLTRGQIYQVGTPTVYYFPSISFTWLEDFDQSGTSLVREPSSPAIMVTVPNGYDQNSGYVHLNNTDTTFFIGSSTQSYLLPAAQEVWVEFNYRSNVAMTVGIAENSGGNTIPWVVLNPSPNWNKAYIRLTDVLAQTGNSSTVNHKVYWAAQNSSALSDAYLYIDNVKLLKQF